MSSEAKRLGQAPGPNRVVKIRKANGVDLWRLTWVFKGRYWASDHESREEAKQAQAAKRLEFAPAIVDALDPNGDLQDALNDSAARCLEPEWWVERLARVAAVASERAVSADNSEIGPLVNSVSAAGTAARKFLESVIRLQDTDDFSTLSAADAKKKADELHAKIFGKAAGVH